MDILNNDDVNLVDEELNLAGLNHGRQNLAEDPLDDEEGDEENEVSDDESSLMTEEEEAATSRIIDE